MTRNNYVIFAFLLIGLSPLARADWRWVPQKNVKVYSEASESSSEVRQIGAGEVVVLSRMQKAESEDWIKIQVRDPENPAKGFVRRSDMVAGDITLAKSKAKGETENKKIIGGGISISQNIRANATGTLTGNQEIDFGPEYGASIYPTLFYEFPSQIEGIYRIFVSYRVLKAQGQVTLKQNGSITSQEVMTQTQNSVTLGFLFRKSLELHPSYWYGYGMEISYGLTGEQDYSDGSVTDLKGNIPTNFFAQTSVGYQSLKAQKWYFLPEAKVGVVFNNKPFDLNIEIFANFGWPL